MLTGGYANALACVLFSALGLFPAVLGGVLWPAQRSRKQQVRMHVRVHVHVPWAGMRVRVRVRWRAHARINSSPSHDAP